MAFKERKQNQNISLTASVVEGVFLLVSCIKQDALSLLIICSEIASLF